MYHVTTLQQAGHYKPRYNLESTNSELMTKLLEVNSDLSHNMSSKRFDGFLKM